jgi:hypothetical protein
MRMPGRKSRIRTTSALVLAGIVLITILPAASRAGNSFLIPGVALSEADFTAGKWCRYLVVDEIMGVRDSSVVYIAVTGVTGEGSEEAYWIEIESAPAGAPAGERETAAALISSNIKQLSPGDSLCQYVSELYIKKGTGTVESADPADLERLTLSNPTADSDWIMVPGETVEIEDRTYVCVHKHLTVEDKREIPMGRVTLLKNDIDVYDVWFNDEVPVFRLVKCKIERVRDSKTVPAVPGIPDKGREISRTTIELVGFGSGATPIIKKP